MEMVAIICLCGNEYEDYQAGMTVEPRCPQCALELDEKYPDRFCLPPKGREIAEQYVKDLNKKGLNKGA